MGADKAYDAEDFVNEPRSMNVCAMWRRTNAAARPSTGAPPAMPATASARTFRKRIEEAFGWVKSVAGQRKTRFRGRDTVGWEFIFAVAAYNLVRLPKLLENPA